MEDSRVFRLIWRINAVVLLGVGIVGFVVGIYALREITQHVFRERVTQDLVPTEATESEIQPQVRYGLRPFRNVWGTDFYSANIYSESQHELMLKSKTSSSSRNYLFYNTKTRASHKLFPTNSNLIVSYTQIPDAYSGEPKPVDAHVVFVVENDTNEDGNLSGRDLRKVYIASPDGKRVTPILDEVSESLGISKFSNDELGISYRKGGKTFVAHINLKNHKVTATSALAF